MVLHVGKRYGSQEEFEKDFLIYTRDHQHVPYSVYNSKAATSFNAKQALEGKSGRIPDSFLWKEAILTCKHYGKPRQHKHKEGTKRRPNQRTFKVFCQAKVNINYNLVQGCYVVTRVNDQHSNHPRNSKLSCMYPEFRKPEQAVVESAEKLMSYEVKTPFVRETVCASGVHATRQDIANLRNRWKEKCNGGKNSSEEEGMLLQLDILKEEDPGSNIAIHYTPDTFEITSIFFQTSEMREAFDQYPEVIIMDTTYKLCLNDMPLIVFQVVDNHGSGRVIGYSLLSSEKISVVSEALKVFAIGCPDTIKKVNIVMVDKDQSEIASVQQVLPHVEVHLCDFHVKNAIERRGIKEANWSTLDTITRRLVDAFNEDDYVEAYEELKTVASSDFFKYYDTNWHSCKSVWVRYKRNLTYNLGLRTTGRVERHNCLIKSLVNRRMSVADVIMRLRILHKIKLKDVMYKDFLSVAKKQYDKYSIDPTIQLICQSNTPFVSDLLKRQYERSLEPPSCNPHVVTVESCDCPFYNNYRLHCSHIFRERHIKDLQVFDPALVPERWAMTVNKEADSDRSTFQLEGISVPDFGPRKVIKQPRVLSSEERFNKSLAVGRNIASKICNYGGQQYDNFMKALTALYDFAAKGQEVMITGLDGNGDFPAGFVCSKCSVKCGENGGELISKESCSEPVAVSTIPQIQMESENVADNQEKGRYINLSPHVRKLLNLPTSPIVRGRPRLKMKRNLKKKKNMEGSKERSLSPKKKCDHCQMPTMLRTSFTKKNYKRQYFACSSMKTKLCKNFYQWLDECSQVQEEHSSAFSPSQHISDDNSEELDDHISESDGNHSEPEPQDDMNDNLISDNGECGLCTESEEKLLPSCVNCGHMFAKPLPSVLVKLEPLDTMEQKLLDDQSDFNLDQQQLEVVTDMVKPVHMNDQSNNEYDKHDEEDLSSIGKPSNSMEEQVLCDRLSDDNTNESLLKAIDNIIGEPKGSAVDGELENCGVSPFKKRKLDTITPPKQYTCFSCKSDAVLCVARSLKNSGRTFMSCQNSLCEKNFLFWIGKSPKKQAEVNKGAFQMNGACTSSKSKKFFPLFQNKECCHCKRHSEVTLVKCLTCQEEVHGDTPCSFASRSQVNGRNCSRCICKFCKHPQLGEHQCMCVVCKTKIVYSVTMCYRCENAAHVLCCLRITDEQKDFKSFDICFTCASNKAMPLALAAMQELDGPHWLQDAHLSMASNLLRKQFPDLKGLQCPLYVASGELVPIHLKYSVPSKDADCIQFCNTGRGHWVTCILKQGESSPYVLDSLGSAMTSETETQVAMLFNCKEDAFKITIPHCQRQTNCYDCGLYAIAFAIEFAFTREISHVSFQEDMLRAHWKKCIEELKLMPFPRVDPKRESKRKNVKQLVKYTITNVYCHCRLPGHYDSSLVGCESCSKWFHPRCVGFESSDDTDKEFICVDCKGEKINSVD